MENWNKFAFHSRWSVSPASGAFFPDRASPAFFCLNSDSPALVVGLFVFSVLFVFGPGFSFHPLGRFARIFLRRPHDWSVAGGRRRFVASELGFGQGFERNL
jgi:hypothetical protein